MLPPASDPLQRLTELERRVADCAAELESVLHALRSLRAELAPAAAGGTRPAPAALAALAMPATPAPAAEPRGSFDPDEMFGEWGPPAARPDPGSRPEPADDDLSFLQELPSSRGGAAAAPPPPLPPPATDRSVRDAAAGVAGAPGAGEGLACRMCGTVSDARAWYCEGCGGELG